MDEAMIELTRQAEAQAKKLENEAGASVPGTCPSHGELSRGVSISLRLLCVQARQPRSLTGVIARMLSVGMSAPICLLIYFIGTGKGWW